MTNGRTDSIIYKITIYNRGENALKAIRLSDGEELYRFCLPLNGANMYLLVSGEKALLTDCFRDGELEEMLQKKRIRELTVLLTHEHWDHASGVEWVRGQVPVCRVLCGIHAKENLEDPRKNMSDRYKALITMRDRSRIREVEQADIHAYAFSPDRTMGDGEELAWENHRFRFFLTPGHTGGSVCILMDGAYLFTGDSLVNGNRTITRFPTGSQEEYERITIPFLENQPGERRVFPGHGEPDRLKNIIDYIYKE